MLGFLIGLIIGAISVNYYKNKLTKEIKDLEVLIDGYESTLAAKAKQITSLKSQIKDMYKTIDEYTSEKNAVEAELEVSEKTLKRKRKK